MRRILRKGMTAANMILSGNVREAVIRTNQKFGFSFVDFGKQSLDELGFSRSTGNEHQASGWELQFVLDKLNITSADSIVDLGAGKGGALLTMAKYPFRGITGVEISPELVKIAKKNMFRLARWNRVRLVCSNAIDYTALDDFNYIYLFNPFPSEVMKVVIGNMKTSLRRCPRNLTVIYANPQCENTFRSEAAFEKTAEHIFPGRAPTVVYSHRPDAAA